MTPQLQDIFNYYDSLIGGPDVGYYFTSDDLLKIEHTKSASSLTAWLTFGFVLFSLGLFGILFNYKNLLVTMIAVELIYLGIVSSFVFYGVACHSHQSVVYALTLLILAACESAIGLGILIVLHRFGRTIAFNSFEQLGG